MATQSSQLLPTIRLRDLPIYNGTVGDTDSILLISQNGVERRLPVNALLGSLENSITSEDVIPSDPLNEGRDGQIAWDETGIYTYYNGIWGKSPKYNAYWADITETTRFLLISQDQVLSDEEKKIGRDNLGVGSATTMTEGIVRLANSIGDGLATVPTAGVVAEYVKSQMANISIPTATSINPPSEGYTTAKLVYDYISRVSLGAATTTTAGVVRLATSIMQNGTGVPTAAQVYAFVKENAGSVGQATTAVYGIVRMATAITSSSADVPTAAQVYNFVKNNLGSVDQATTSSYGTVRLTNTISAGNSYVPTAGTVYSYVKTQLDNLDVGSIDQATTSSYGTVRLTNTISAGSSYVPTAGTVYSYVKNQLDNLTINVGEAGINKRGTVVLTGTFSDNPSSTNTDVPTQYAIAQFVNRAISKALENIPTQSQGSGGGTTGMVDLSNYQGAIHLRGKDGVTVLQYDEQSSTLYIGKGVCKVVMQPNHKFEIRNIGNIVESEIITGENCSGGALPSPTPGSSGTTPNPTDPNTPNPSPSGPQDTNISGTWGWNSNLRTPTITVTGNDTVIEGDLFIVGSALITGSLVQRVTVQ